MTTKIITDTEDKANLLTELLKLLGFNINVTQSNGRWIIEASRKPND